MSNPLPSLLIRAVAPLCRDKSGASATIVAIALPALIGFGALGTEAGLWFTIKLRNQSAADAAAIAAADEVIAGKTDVSRDLTPAASEAAARNGYNGSAPAVTYPYSDGVIRNGVAVILQQTQKALLATMFLPEVTVANRAVAVIEPRDRPCILALGNSGTDIEIADSTRLYLTDCSAVADSISATAIDLHGSTSSIAATTLVTVGEVSLQGNPIDPAAAPPQFDLTSPAMIGASSVPDPYAAALTHAFLTSAMPTSGRCRSSRAGGVRTYTGNCIVAGTSLTQTRIKLSANTQISGAWTIRAGQTVDLSPGAYWVSGDLSLQMTAVLKCSACDNNKGVGATIILPAQANTVGAISIASGAIINLNAPNAGPFAGLLIVQDSNGLPPGTRYASSYSTIGGAPGSTLNGLLYFPNSSLTFHGDPSVAGLKCLLVVVSTMTIDADSSLNSFGCVSAGLTNFLTVNTVALAE